MWTAESQETYAVAALPTVSGRESGRKNDGSAVAPRGAVRLKKLRGGEQAREALDAPADSYSILQIGRTSRTRFSLSIVLLHAAFFPWERKY